ncbi:hypothetical protein Sphch_2136 [Sphingobium chlorophenolicum L-1]|uniref:Uncharacterized protein n=1 Tax=Sphingobium chlorophenolicum L-1 TaxID=690566 RepID=F6EWB1_SPHCR|nr:hypothetical protein Sphch_2136 [Sphingobium chlorophenolicum L-1]
MFDANRQRAFSDPIQDDAGHWTVKQQECADNLT